MRRSTIAPVIAAGALALSSALPARAAGSVVVSGPGSTYTTYTTPVAVAQVGGELTYVNGDLATHDVVARDDTFKGERNLIRNTSFEVIDQDLNLPLHWQGVAGTRLRAAGEGVHGAHSVTLSRDQAGDSLVASSLEGNLWPVSPSSSTFTASASVRPESTPRDAFLQIDWLAPVQGTLKVVAVSAGPDVEEAAGEWTRLSFTVTAPGKPTAARLGVGIRSVEASEGHEVDAVQVEAGPALTDYQASPAVWCDSDAYPPNQCPIFWSQLIGLGRTTPVLGLENVVAGETYVFYCVVHPYMTGTLVALPA